MRSLTFKLSAGLSLFVLLDLAIGSFYIKHYAYPPFARQVKRESAGWNRIFSPYFHHGFIPSSHALYSWGPYQYDVFINSLGLRDKTEAYIPQRTGNYRILFLGDSFVEGLGLPYQDTFIGILDQQLPSNIEV
jgi:hypothetical protein